jgi:hypothetical protein
MKGQGTYILDHAFLSRDRGAVLEQVLSKVHLRSEPFILYLIDGPLKLGLHLVVVGVASVVVTPKQTMPLTSRSRVLLLDAHHIQIGTCNCRPIKKFS